MLALSVLLVAAVIAVLAANLGSQGDELRFGYQQLVHARVPWLLLLPLWVGCALGIASLLRRRGLWRGMLVGAEGLLTALVSWYFLWFSFLPAHTLALEVGDPLPSYALVDQDGVLRRMQASTPREPALYIFYRGDW